MTIPLVRSPFRALSLVVLTLALLGAIGCSPGTGARGWAAPVKVSENVLLVSTGKGRLDAIDVRTGDPLWRFPNRWEIVDSKARGLDGIYAAPVISSDGRTIFVGDRNGYVYAFRPDDLSVSDTSIKPTAGALKLKGPIIGGLVLDASSGNLFVTSGERLFAIRTADLERRIENRDANVGVIELFKAGGDIWSAPIVQGGRIFFASLDGNLYAINATSGEEAWRFKGTRALVSSPVVTDGGLVLVGGFDDRLHAIDMASGRQRWDFVAANWIWTSPVVDGGRAYVGDFDGTVHALNLSDGSPIWSKPIAKRPIVASPVLAQGVLVIAAQNGELYGLDPGTQTQRWGPSDVGTSLNADLVADGELVYLAPNGCVTPVNESNRVYYISVNARTGDLTKTTEVC